jgi:hypothetical protein
VSFSKQSAQLTTDHDRCVHDVIAKYEYGYFGTKHSKLPDGKWLVGAEIWDSHMCHMADIIDQPNMGMQPIFQAYQG